MTAIKNQTLNPPAASPADTPQPTVKLDPEVIVEQIRSIRSQIDDVTPLTPQQRRAIRNRSRKQSDGVVASSINMIGALDNVAQAIGQSPDDVRQLQTDWTRWTAVADELRGLLSGIEGANLVRRQQLSLIAAQAFTIGVQLARNPANSVLVPHIQEVKRQKSFSRPKKAPETPPSPTPNGTPAPSEPAPAHDTSAMTPKA